jgi:hypothetical protein
MRKILYLLLFIPFGVFGQTEVVNVGASANDGTGDPLRSAFIKVNTNFTAVRDSFGNIYREVQTRALVNDSLDQLRADATLFLTALIAETYVADNSIGGNDTYTATTVGSFTYTVGRVIVFHPLTLNTGACTLAINGGTAYAIKTQADGDPGDSDMVATGFYPLCWDGANWVLMTK